MNEFKFELGKKAKDKITGFQGVITGFCRYLTGCDTYCITPKVSSEGGWVDGKWIDEGRIKLIGEEVYIEKVSADENGGPHDNAPRCK